MMPVYKDLYALRLNMNRNTLIHNLLDMNSFTAKTRERSSVSKNKPRFRFANVSMSMKKKNREDYRMSLSKLLPMIRIKTEIFLLKVTPPLTRNPLF
jgi:hypothetical protein